MNDVLPLPLITLVTTCFNAAQTIDECLASAVAQTFGAWRLVLVDDGSSDDSSERAAQWAAGDPRIELFRQPRAGRRAALQYAHDKVSSKLVAWLDADDRLHPAALEKTLEVMSLRDDVAMVYTDCRHIGASGEPAKQHPKPAFSSRAMLHDFIPFHFRLIRSSAFDRAGGIRSDVEIGIDYDLCLRINEIGPIVHMPEVLYDYRVHSSQMSSLRRSEQRAASARAVEEAIARRRLPLRLHVSQKGVFSLRPVPSTRFRVRGPAAVARALIERARPTKTPSRAIEFAAVRPANDLLSFGISEGLHHQGVAVKPISADLPSFVRTVWQGGAPDVLVLRQLGKVLGGSDPGERRAKLEILLATMARARVGGCRVVWANWEDVHEPALLEAQASIAAQCDAQVARPASVVGLLPFVSRQDARRSLGLPHEAWVAADDSAVGSSGAARVIPTSLRPYDLAVATAACDVLIVPDNRSTEWSFALAAEARGRLFACHISSPCSALPGACVYRTSDELQEIRRGATAMSPRTTILTRSWNDVAAEILGRKR